MSNYRTKKRGKKKETTGQKKKKLKKRKLASLCQQGSSTGVQPSQKETGVHIPRVYR